MKKSGISYLGQIASLDRSEFLKLPNAGKSSWNEIFAIVQKYDLLLYANIEWPGHEFVKDLVSQRQLDVGKPLAIGSQLQQRLSRRQGYICSSTPIQFKVLAGRVGLGDDEVGMTLQELADAKIVGEKVVARANSTVRSWCNQAIKIKLSAEPKNALR